MRFLYLLFFSTFTHLLPAQDMATIEQKPKTAIDSLYREDQFYVGITYNNMVSAPSDYSRDKISTGFTVGMLRDMPINKNRTIAIAAGLGATYNSYNHNLGIPTGQSSYTILSDVPYTKNKFSTLTVDLPVELRWRTSTFESTKFWRIYAGAKMSYLVYDYAVLRAASGANSLKNNPDLNKLNFGIYLATGYNTFNVYAHYGVNSLFKSGQVGNEKIQLRNFNIGLLFYIL